MAADNTAYKIAFIGPCGSGKTSIINRFHEKEFSQRADPTVGASFVTHDVATPQGVISLNIWDTAGQERYKSLVPMYCRSAVALIVVYDVTGKESFEESKQWCEKFRTPDGPGAQGVYYVGNKTDLQYDEADLDGARDYAASVGAAFFETSAKTGEGIDALFQAIAANLAAKRRHESTVELTRLEKRAPEGHGPCC
jgi:Ras-related protein Rab-5C